MAYMDPQAPALDTAAPNAEQLTGASPVVHAAALPSPTENTAAGVVLEALAAQTSENNAALLAAAEAPDAEAGTAEPETPQAESGKPETGKPDATVEGNGDGNGQLPGGMTEDEEGGVQNPAGHYPPGQNRGEKPDKPENPNKPEKPDKPGQEGKDDQQANKAQKGTHVYTYDELNRMVSSNIAKVLTNYTYDTLGNLVLEKVKNKGVDYQYNELNQLVQKTTTQNETFTYSYDRRGNRVAENGKKTSREFVYDATNRMVSGTNWKGDESAYTYNGLGLRVNNTHTTHAGKVYDRDYVIDYTSPENDDLYVYALGNGQLEYEQKHVYAGSERIEQFHGQGELGAHAVRARGRAGQHAVLHQDHGAELCGAGIRRLGAAGKPEQAGEQRPRELCVCHLHGAHLRHGAGCVLCRGAVLRRGKPPVAGDGPH